MKKRNIKRGDIFYVKKANEPVVGSEQNGGRPAIIVSNDIGNYHAPIVEIVYLTTKNKKNQPTHANVMATKPSIAVCEQVHTVSKERLQEKIGTLSEEEMNGVDRSLFNSFFMGTEFEMISNNESKQIPQPEYC